jgi:hypothetical protein
MLSRHAMTAARVFVHTGGMVCTRRRSTPAFTLLRYAPQSTTLTGVAQVTTAQRALALIMQWQQQFPAETTLVYDLANRPVTTTTLRHIAVRDAERGDG